MILLLPYLEYWLPFTPAHSFHVMLGIKLRDSCILSKHSTYELYYQAPYATIHLRKDFSVDFFTSRLSSNFIFLKTSKLFFRAPGMLNFSELTHLHFIFTPLVVK